METDTDLVTSAYFERTFVYFDVETIPCQDEAYLEVLKRKVKAPASYKKKESVDAWLAENRESAALDEMAKTSFDGGRGHVCTIAWARNDGEILTAHAKTVDEEKSVISDFFEDLRKYRKEILVGHNISGFDLGFLRKRAIALGLRMPDHRTFPRDPKPWMVSDTMSMWAGGTNRISLDDLCSILGIPGKDGFDGSQVAEAWANGEHDKIAEYCRDDVWRVREIHKRFLQADF